MTIPLSDWPKDRKGRYIVTSKTEIGDIRAIVNHVINQVRVMADTKKLSDEQFVAELNRIEPFAEDAPAKARRQWTKQRAYVTGAEFKARHFAGDVRPIRYRTVRDWWIG